MLAGLVLPLWLLTASPEPAERAMFVFELSGVAVGTVELTWQPASGQFRYQSVQLFTRGQDASALRRDVQLEVDQEGNEKATGLQPASLWVWRRPLPGCVAGKDELSGARGELCASPERGGEITGALLGQSFTARYGSRGQLLELALPGARFVLAEAGTKVPTPPDLFGEGVLIRGSGARIEVEPPVVVGRPSKLASGLAGPGWTEAAARRLADTVNASFVDAEPGPSDLVPKLEERAQVGSCLAHATRFLRLAGPSRAQLVFGLRVEGERAYPHVWVTVRLGSAGWLELDPTSLDPVTPATHLALCAEPGRCKRAGALYLELFRGTRRLVRR